MEQLYICSKCDAKKTIVKPSHMSKTVFEQQLPKRVICGFRGCASYATKKEN